MSEPTLTERPGRETIPPRGAFLFAEWGIERVGGEWHAGGMSEPSLTERRGRETNPLGAFLFFEGESGGVPFATDRTIFCFKNSFCAEKCQNPNFWVENWDFISVKKKF